MIPHSKPYTTTSDRASVIKRLNSGMLTEGKKVAEFEAAIAKYCGSKFGIASSCGTSAIVMALKAIGIKSNDEVILPSYVCKSVADAIIYAGAVPVFCDISEYWIMTPETISKKITSKTKAIILVHIFGINAWNNDLKKFKIPIIEDNCQALGYEKRERPFKLKGAAAILSFNATKCIATGEGGMLITDNKELYQAALKIKSKQYAFHKITDLQASLGLSQIAQYNKMKKKRREIAKKYYGKLPSSFLVKTQKIKSNSIFYRFPISINKKVDDCMAYFEQNGIAVRRGVDTLLHREFGLSDKDFKQTVSCFNSTVSIPLYPALTNQEVSRIIKITNNYFNHERIR